MFICGNVVECASKTTDRFDGRKDLLTQELVTLYVMRGDIFDAVANCVAIANGGRFKIWKQFSSGLFKLNLRDDKAGIVRGCDTGTELSEKKRVAKSAFLRFPRLSIVAIIYTGRRSMIRRISSVIVRNET